MRDQFLLGAVLGAAFAFIVTVSLITAFGGCRSHGEEAMMRYAVTKGHARWAADDAGDPVFTWHEATCKPASPEKEQ